MTSTKIFGLIGYPVKHSLSPLMHNAAFKALKIGAEYKLFEINPQDLSRFLGNIDKEDICGLNVTIPYKEKVLDFVYLDPESLYLKQVRAVNTIVKKEGKLKGFNTDIPGFARHLKEYFNPEARKAAIIGAGGASRAVAYVLAKSGAAEIAVFDIENKKTENLIQTIKGLFPNISILAVDSIERLDLKNKDLLVNATAVGMKETDPCLVEESMLHKGLFVYDLIYNPASTKLLSAARKIGAEASNGLGMLLYQGALAFEHFTGEKAPLEIMRKALEEGARQL